MSTTSPVYGLSSLQDEKIVRNFKWLCSDFYPAWTRTLNIKRNGILNLWIDFYPKGWWLACGTSRRWEQNWGNSMKDIIKSSLPSLLLVVWLDFIFNKKSKKAHSIAGLETQRFKNLKSPLPWLFWLSPKMPRVDFLLFVYCNAQELLLSAKYATRKQEYSFLHFLNDCFPLKVEDVCCISHELL